MQKHNGLTAEELKSLGYELQPDGRLRLYDSWKSQCPVCGLWFHRLKHVGCKQCDDKATIAHRRDFTDSQKKCNDQT